VLLTFFWDHKGVILEHFLEQRQTSNSERYSDMFQNQLLSQQYEENAVVFFVLWHVFAA
jgi:hypothetical protein